MYVCDTGRHTVLKLYALHIQYIHMYVHMYIHTNICTDVHIHICTYVHTYVHIYLRTYIPLICSPKQAFWHMCRCFGLLRTYLMRPNLLAVLAPTQTLYAGYCTSVLYCTVCGSSQYREHQRTVKILHCNGNLLHLYIFTIQLNLNSRTLTETEAFILCVQKFTVRVFFIASFH